MKALLAYWLIGCFILGGVMAVLMKECPNDTHKVDASAIVAVAIWPAFIVTAVSLSWTDYKPKPTQCSVLP